MVKCAGPDLEWPGGNGSSSALQPTPDVGEEGALVVAAASGFRDPNTCTNCDAASPGEVCASMAPNAVVCRHPQATAATGSVSGTRLGVATTSSTSLAAAAEDDVDDEEEDDDEEVSACAVFCAVTGYPS